MNSSIPAERERQRTTRTSAEQDGSGTKRQQAPASSQKVPQLPSMLTSAVRQKRSGQADCLKTTRVPLTAFTTLRFQFKTRRPNNLTPFMIFTLLAPVPLSTAANTFEKWSLAVLYRPPDQYFLSQWLDPHVQQRPTLTSALGRKPRSANRSCCSGGAVLPPQPLSACVLSNSWCVCVCVLQFKAPHGDLFVFFPFGVQLFDTDWGFIDWSWTWGICRAIWPLFPRLSALAHTTCRSKLKESGERIHLTIRITQRSIIRPEHVCGCSQAWTCWLAPYSREY